MSTRARCEKEKEKLKAVILEAAINIIAEAGYDKLSMRKIADVIDYTPTTIYSYYKDKAQIVDDISQQIYDKIISDIKIVFEENKEKPADQQLWLAFNAFLHSITAQPEMGKAVIGSGTGSIFGPTSASEPVENSGVLILNKFLLEGQRQSVFRKLDSNISWMLITALIGFAMNALENQLYLNEDWNDLVNAYTEMLIKGLLLDGR
ncbi:MAG: TetR/AcrR family transcriptional regulator [Defluviitaleaceae bacterium]|nr:TetR/AcrR family transcriptional regulator [Defluviitaleaceae bacterium]